MRFAILCCDSLRGVQRRVQQKGGKQMQATHKRKQTQKRKFKQTQKRTHRVNQGGRHQGGDNFTSFLRFTRPFFHPANFRHDFSTLRLAAPWRPPWSTAWQTRAREQTLTPPCIAILISWWKVHKTKKWDTKNTMTTILQLYLFSISPLYCLGKIKKGQDLAILSHTWPGQLQHLFVLGELLAIFVSDFVFFFFLCVCVCVCVFPIFS